jgi:hypothetical protein
MMNIEDAWMDLEREFRLTPMASPRPGFAARWQTRLAAAEARRIRNVRWIAGALLLIAALAALLLSWSAVSELGSMASGFLASLVSVSVFIITVTEVTAGVLSRLSLNVWLVLIASCAALLALWAEALRRTQSVGAQ